VRVGGITAVTPFMLAEFTTVRVTSGSKPGPVLEDMMEQIRSPLLLVSARGEYDSGVAYDRAVGDRPVEHWHLADVSHTDAIRQAAPEYERRVTAFFDQALRNLP
jgi:hypothetical protein